MKLNGIDCLGRQLNGGGSNANFLLDCTRDEADALDGQTLTLTDDDGGEIAVFGGFHLTIVAEEGAYMRAYFSKRLEPNVEQAIEANQRNIEIVRRDAEGAGRRADAARTGADAASRSAGEANALANANAEAIEELAAAVFTE